MPAMCNTTGLKTGITVGIEALALARQSHTVEVQPTLQVARDDLSEPTLGAMLPPAP